MMNKLKQAIENYRVLRDSKYEWVQGMINVIEHLKKCDDIQNRLYWTMEQTLQMKEDHIERMEAELKAIRAEWDKLEKQPQ